MTTDPNTLSQAQELHLLYCMAQGKTTDIAQDWENLGEERQALIESYHVGIKRLG